VAFEATQRSPLEGDSEPSAIASARAQQLFAFGAREQRSAGIRDRTAHTLLAFDAVGEHVCT
jgi:hypothetical protein